MIREDDLREAIAECEGSKHPTASTCLKLAAYYAILNQKFSPKQADTDGYTMNDYSFSSSPDVPYSKTEFSQIVREKGIAECFPVIDEAMSALLMVNPKLYSGVIRKLTEL